MKLNFITVALIIVCLAAGRGHAADSAETTDGFALPEPGHVFSFPRDYGSHDDFKIEWWYITGHLFRADGHRFGFQATFFRSAGLPATANTDTNNANFGHGTLFLAHMALLDVPSGTYLHQQKLNRRGWDAYSATNELDVRNGNWALRMTDTNSRTMQLNGSVNGDASFQLKLTPQKPLVQFGKDSVSRKAADPTAASYYLTFPRLQATGQVVLNSETNAVTGEAWMDHEISSSQLGSDQAGWDWCCLQFTGGREIMAYRMRHRDGSQDDFSSLTWINTNAVLAQLPSAQFQLEVVRTWKSPRTGAVYPVSVRLHTRNPWTNQSVTFLLEPLAEDQELAGHGSLAYWEGACRIRDEAGKEIGSAFLELTGYSGDMQKSLR
jgi:predicted secreted hydrolase